MPSQNRLELTWVGKYDTPRLEPRILLEHEEKSYAATQRVSEADRFDNLLIHGDNLLALKALEQEYTGKVRCIYIDPPYNIDAATNGQYDDSLEHSLWLSMLRHRLAIFHRLLNDQGSIWISIDDQEGHYLKVVCDEIFGRQNFIASVVWEKDKGGRGDASISISHDYVLIYSKNKETWTNTRNPLPRTETQMNRFKNPDNDPRGPWRQGDDGTAKSGTEKQRFPITLPSGRTTVPPPGRYWAFSQESLQKARAENRAYFGKSGDSMPIIKRYLSEVRDGVAPRTWWPSEEAGSNMGAKRDHLNKPLNGVTPFSTPKPEELLFRILHIATNPGDLVLDSFAGSGTTGAVAHKMGRRWIMVELGDHCDTHIVPRLRKVIDGQDPGGVTEATGWKGGGGFRYYNLAPTLMERDDLGQWVINPKYNREMLAEAICKHENFTYAPSPTVYWQQGHSTERDFIYVTTQTLSAERLDALSAEVGPDRTLLVHCLAHRGAADRWPNLTVRKLPNTILDRCEWGRDDYSLKISSLGAAPVTTDADEAAPSAPAKKKPGRKPKADTDQPDLFSASAKPTSGEDK